MLGTRPKCQVQNIGTRRDRDAQDSEPKAVPVAPIAPLSEHLRWLAIRSWMG
jgi:hypothetical protein